MARRPPRPDWSRLLPRPLVIPTVLRLTTLADVRALIERHLPSDRRDVPAWRYVRQKLDEAASGGKAMDVAVALQIALLGGRRMPAEVRPTPFTEFLNPSYGKAKAERKKEDNLVLLC